MVAVSARELALAPSPAEDARLRPRARARPVALPPTTLHEARTHLSLLKHEDGPAPVELRQKARALVALKAWVVDERESVRGYVLDLSDGGARVGGVGTRIPVGARVLLKVVVDERSAPVVVRAHAVRYDFVRGVATLSLMFLEVGFDDAFRLGRVVDRALTRG